MKVMHFNNYFLNLQLIKINESRLKLKVDLTIPFPLICFEMHLSVLSKMRFGESSKTNFRHEIKKYFLALFLFRCQLFLDANYLVTKGILKTWSLI